MELNFLGIGSCFANDHNSAFFMTDDSDLVMIDCPELAYETLKEHFNFSLCKNIYVYITHTHCDHISGLGEFIQYAYYCLQKHVFVIAPSDNVNLDIKTLLNIEAVEDIMYTLITTFDLIDSLIPNKSIAIPPKALGISILTEHVKQLKNKCFGYQFNINGTNVIYTGDSSTLKTFIPYLTDNSELYMDTSVAHKSDVHIWLVDVLPTLLSLIKKGVKIYLMHLDDVDIAKELTKDIPEINVVTHYFS